MAEDFCHLPSAICHDRRSYFIGAAYGPTSTLPCVSLSFPSSAVTPFAMAAVSLAFWKQVKLLEQIAEGEALEVVKDAQGHETNLRRSAAVSERLKAIDLLAKYGLGTTVTETDTEGHDVIRVIREPRILLGDR